MSIIILDEEFDIDEIELNLREWGLTIFPFEIFNFANLKKLIFYKNHLTTLPSEIGSLTGLKEILLTSNDIINIPKEIGNLTNLEILCLTDNNLTHLPIEIGNITNLHELYLGDNELLPELPAEIGNLTKLVDLDLSNMKLKKIPIEILKIKSCLFINETSYDGDNMDPEAKFIILRILHEELNNLPVIIKEIWVTDNVDMSLIKIPFGCDIKRF